MRLLIGNTTQVLDPNHPKNLSVMTSRMLDSSVLLVLKKNKQKLAYLIVEI